MRTSASRSRVLASPSTRLASRIRTAAGSTSMTSAAGTSAAVSASARARSYSSPRRLGATASSNAARARLCARNRLASGASSSVGSGARRRSSAGGSAVRASQAARPGAVSRRATRPASWAASRPYATIGPGSDSSDAYRSSRSSA
ncbi:hypothetical protein [Micromonospora sp. NPDC047074]|uniref:hypothetical protein n=1 Tax=Micromonospora sp. NPDC047074 TaxID=3154339 RepID=UPI003411403E